jgi:hypothetical protein
LSQREELGAGRIGDVGGGAAGVVGPSGQAGVVVEVGRMTTEETRKAGVGSDGKRPAGSVLGGFE